MKREKIAIITLLMSYCICVSGAHKVDDDGSKSRLYYNERNYLYNILTDLSNPINLSFNKVKTASVANISYSHQEGDFYKSDKAKEVNNLGLGISGLESFGKLSIGGNMAYGNILNKEQGWNTSLFLSPDNPFVLGNEEKSDINIEQFSLSAGASYQHNKLTGAFKVNYLTAASSGQTDPRARIRAMRLRVTPGLLYEIGRQWAIGLSADVELYHSDISHSVVNNYENYSYYIMKGTGNYEIRTSSDQVSYPREYKGMYYKGAFQLIGKSADSNVSNAIELSLSSNEEISKDGGNVEFKSGDFFSDEYSLHNRLSIGMNSDIIHNITIGFAYKINEGYWYDQKKTTDPEHGNISYWKVLQRYKLEEHNIISGGMSYQLDMLKNDRPNYTFKLETGYNSSDVKHYEGKTYSQKYSLATIGLEARKYWHLKRLNISWDLAACMTKQIGDSNFDFVKNEIIDIVDIYEAPYFEYLSSGKVAIKSSLNFIYPIRKNGKLTYIGLQVDVKQLTYQGDNEYSDNFDGASHAHLGAKIFLNF